MIAKHDVTALFNGRRYEFKKGQQVDAPPALLEALKKQGAVTAQRKRKASDD